MTTDPPLFIGAPVVVPESIERHHAREAAHVDVTWADGHKPRHPERWSGRTLIPAPVGHNDERD